MYLWKRPIPPHSPRSAYGGSSIKGQQVRLSAENVAMEAVLVLEGDKKSEEIPATASTLADKPAVT